VECEKIVVASGFTKKSIGVADPAKVLRLADNASFGPPGGEGFTNFRRIVG